MAGLHFYPPESIVLALNPSRTSERNHLTGTVAMIRRNGVNWTVTVDVSGTLLDSSVTTGALDDLEIREGSRYAFPSRPAPFICSEAGPALRLQAPAFFIYSTGTAIYN